MIVKWQMVVLCCFVLFSSQNNPNISAHHLHPWLVAGAQAFASLGTKGWMRDHHGVVVIPEEGNCPV